MFLELSLFLEFLENEKKTSGPFSRPTKWIGRSHAPPSVSPARGPLRTAEGAERPGDGIPQMSNLLQYLTLQHLNIASKLSLCLGIRSIVEH